VGEQRREGPVRIVRVIARLNMGGPALHVAYLAAGLQERYVREWLGAMATAGIVEYDSGRGGFRLPPEHAAMTTRAGLSSPA